MLRIEREYRKGREGHLKSPELLSPERAADELDTEFLRSIQLNMQREERRHKEILTNSWIYRIEYIPITVACAEWIIAETPDRQPYAEQTTTPVWRELATQLTESNDGARYWYVGFSFDDPLGEEAREVLWAHGFGDLIDAAHADDRNSIDEVDVLAKMMDEPPERFDKWNIRVAIGWVARDLYGYLHGPCCVYETEAEAKAAKRDTEWPITEDASNAQVQA